MRAGSQDRALLWTFSSRARIDSLPAIAGGRVCVGSSDGHLYVLDLASGAKLQELDLGGPITASPALGDGRLLIGTQEGRLFCLG
jgi:eukaryotic-like serine/threonine-protein kinase